MSGTSRLTFAYRLVSWRLQASTLQGFQLNCALPAVFIHDHLSIYLRTKISRGHKYLQIVRALQNMLAVLYEEFSRMSTCANQF